MAWLSCSCSSSLTTTYTVSVIPTTMFAASKILNQNCFREQNYNSLRFEKPETTFIPPRFIARSKITESEVELIASPSSKIDCIGTGLDVECVVNTTDDSPRNPSEQSVVSSSSLFDVVSAALDFVILISPFFFWGTAMVAMKGVLPKTGPFFVAAFRLIPSGFLLIAFAALRGRNFPWGFNAWISILAFALIDASGFQGFLAEGLTKTTAGLGSVIIDSQPLTVAVLASLLFGESIGPIGAVGLFLGVVGLLLLEVPAISVDKNFSLWGSGEWWMLLAAQSMAIGTIMVRWVSKYSDPIMATGWHMVIGGLPLIAISIINHDPIFGRYDALTQGDFLALFYTSMFGSAISYGVYFYNATRGSLTKLSSLTFLTPVFASFFGFLYLNEMFTPLQLVGACITVAAIYMVNYKAEGEAE